MNKMVTLIAFSMLFLFACKKSENLRTPIGVASIADETHFCTSDLHHLENGNRTSAVGTAITFWPTNPNGRTVIRVKFLNGRGTPLSEKIKKCAKQWEQYAYVTFDFIDGNEFADVRISMENGKGCWSYRGTECVSVPQNMATLNFDLLNDLTGSDNEFNHIVLHQFGHVLGLSNEQVHPNSFLQLNKTVVINHYTRKYGFSKEAVESAFFTNYADGRQFSPIYDQASVMHDRIPVAFTLDGRGVGLNSELSAEDKNFTAERYPAPASAETLLYTIREHFRMVQVYANRKGEVILRPERIVRPMAGFSSIPPLGILPEYKFTLQDRFGREYKFETKMQLENPTYTGLRHLTRIIKDSNVIWSATVLSVSVNAD